MQNYNEKKYVLNVKHVFLNVNAEIKAWTDPMLFPDLHVHDAFYKQCKIIMNRT